MKRAVDTDYYFSEEQRFPWDMLGLTRPSYGPPHSYLASMLAPFAKTALERSFLETRPSRREMDRFIRIIEDADVCRFIFSFTESLDRDRSSNAAKVLRGLGQYTQFVRWAGEHLTTLMNRGEIRLPKGAVRVVWESEK